MNLSKREIKSNKAVSEILGSILLLGISIMLFSGAYISFFSVEVEDASPSVNIMALIKDNKLIFEHRGGDDITAESNIILTNESDNSTTFTAEVYLQDYNNNGRWDIGERVICNLSEISDSSQDFVFNRYENLSICIIDPKSNTLLIMGTLQEEI